MNTVKKLRKSLGLSRRAFADLLALSESRVEQIEAEPNDELTAKLARIAEEHGLHEIAAELRGSAEDAAPAPPSIDKLVNRALAAGATEEEIEAALSTVITLARRRSARARRARGA